jgi:hypothetical protein
VTYLGSILDRSHADRILRKLEPQVLDWCGSITNTKPFRNAIVKYVAFVLAIPKINRGTYGNRERQ